jgi:hypothetical protein
MSTIAAYPLQWPSGWPRTTARESGRFKTELPSALKALKREVELLGGKGLVLSSNYTLGAERPADPGVVAYFDLRNQAIAVPCDRWQVLAHNVHAIALTIEAMRGMERWGAKHMITAMFKGFKALPARSGPSCWEVRGVPQTASEPEVMAAWRRKAVDAHPDRGGSHADMAALNEAKDLALSTIRSL